MKTIAYHRFPDHLARIRDSDLKTIRLFLEQDKQGTGDLRYAREGVRKRAVSAAVCSLLSVPAEESEARRYFELAAVFALKALTTRRRDPTARGPEIDVSAKQISGREKIDSIKPLSMGYGPARMSMIDFGYGLFTIGAFGADDAWRTAASIPEVDYRSPGIVAPEGSYATLRCFRAWALGDRERASRELEVSAADPEASSDLDVQALLCLRAHDTRGFLARLRELVIRHKKQGEKRLGDMGMGVQLAGMALCRLALRQGIVVEDQNYLPLRFMPGHPENRGVDTTEMV